MVPDMCRGPFSCCHSEKATVFLFFLPFDFSPFGERAHKITHAKMFIAINGRKKKRPYDDRQRRGILFFFIHLFETI